MTAFDSRDQDQASPQAMRSFAELAEPFRRELKVHCYRMLGSLQDAEDAVQDAYLRAWRSFDAFEGRGSLRSWLYQIATNTCLDALASRKRSRRWLPDQRGPASSGMPDGKPASDVAWLEPIPDSELDAIADDAPDPEARYASRQAVELAFVAAIQQLPPRQRAVLLLSDVLGWAATEAATLLGGSTASINSALQRARATLAKNYPSGHNSLTAPPSPAQQELLARYLRAWESLDVDGLVTLLREDAIYTMPPLSQWYAGRRAIRNFFDRAWKMYDGYRLVPTAANRQPAFAAYARTRADAPWTAHSVHLLSLEQRAISRLTLFYKPVGPRLFEAFKLPQILADTPQANDQQTRPPGP